MKLQAVVVLILSFLSAQAQTYEVGAVLGGANYIGDIGNESYISPSGLSFGVMGKWNRSRRHSFRASVLYIDISDDDADANDTSRVQRDISFSNIILEGSLGIEYTFLDWDLYTERNAHTPYLYTGVTGIRYDELSFDTTSNEMVDDGASWNFAIPMVIGYKARVSEHFIIAGELGARYTFTDNLDGSAPENGIEIGDTSNNDWYFFTGIIISYTWGRKPCYCVF